MSEAVLRAVYPRRGEFGAIFDRGGGVSGILFYTAKIRKKVETSKL